jgi:hypothetical protein
MSNIYEHKARKYKIKYLKLKKELEGGSFKTLLKKLFNSTTYKTNCTTSPPISLDGLNITQEYIKPNTNIKDIINEEHIGNLLSCKDKIYEEEFKKFKKVSEYDPNHTYTSELKFAGLIEKKGLKDKSKYNSIYNCKNELIDSADINNYGYIISTKVGKTFNILDDNDINENNIKQILQNLKNGIDEFITKLYGKDGEDGVDGYILGDIKMENMTLDNNKVYFINYSKMHKYKDKNQVEKFAKESNYPYILKRFFEIKEKNVNKEFLINFFNDNKITNPKDYIFGILKDKEEYNTNEIYEKYILPIARNIDIYALSMFINSILDKNNFIIGQKKSEITDELARSLYIDAIYNKIDGPRILSERLQQIINSIDK